VAAAGVAALVLFREQLQQVRTSTSRGYGCYSGQAPQLPGQQGPTDAVRLLNSSSSSSDNSVTISYHCIAHPCIQSELVGISHFLTFPLNLPAPCRWHNLPISGR